MAGVVLMGISYPVAGMKLSGYSSVQPGDYKKMTYVCESDVQGIDIRNANAVLRIESDEVDKVTVEYYESGKENFTFKEENGVLIMEGERQPVSTIGVDFSFIDTVVTVPTDFRGDVKAVNQMGSMEVEELNVKSLVLENKSGSTEISDVKVARNADITNNSGETILQDVECDNMNFVNSSGGSEISDLTVRQNLSLDNRSGAIEISDVDVAGEITMDSSTGAIEGTLCGSEKDYTITSSVKMGECNLPNREGGNRVIRAQVSTGAIEIEFTEDK